MREREGQAGRERERENVRTEAEVGVQLSKPEGKQEVLS
jgi:hypothetical protein